MCKEYNLEKFIHLSALGINEAVDSNYAQSKLNGEMNILKHFPKANILRPSIVYSVDDNFTTNFMFLLSNCQFFPYITLVKQNLCLFIALNLQI